MLLDKISVGTKSVLFGAHAFWLHPFFVAYAWTKLYGFPLDHRLWAAFFLHDIGYIGKPNMDGDEGEQHPKLGAKVMRTLFGDDWGDFTLLHSRYFAKRLGRKFSRLCVADKLSFTLTPRWLYLPMVNATGELKEYMGKGTTDEVAVGASAALESGDYMRAGALYNIYYGCKNKDQRQWHKGLYQYMRLWVQDHKSGDVDTWTPAVRHTSEVVGV